MRERRSPIGISVPSNCWSGGDLFHVEERSVPRPPRRETRASLTVSTGWRPLVAARFRRGVGCSGAACLRRVV